MISNLKKKLNKKGFTLAELLIVVAIIGVLVAISIPVFGSQLKKAEHATDVANVRAKYAELVADAMMSNNYNAAGKIEIAKSSLESGVATKSTVAAVDGKITVTHTGDNTLTKEISVDSDVTFTS